MNSWFLEGEVVVPKWISPLILDLDLGRGPSCKVCGGHAVCAVGYDDFQQCFIVRNSWGEDWGDQGRLES